MLKELRKLFNTTYKMGDCQNKMYGGEPTYKFRFMLADDKEIELNVVMYEDLSFIPKKVYMFEDRNTLINLKFIERIYLFFKIRKELRRKKKFKKDSVRNKFSSFVNENIQTPTVTAAPAEKIRKPLLSIIKDPRKLFT